MDIARQIRRFQTRPSDERVPTSPAAAAKTSMPKRTSVMGADGSRSSSTQPGLITTTEDRFRADGGNEVHGEQWSHMECRGHMGHLRRFGHQGYEESGQDIVVVDLWNENDVEINCTGNVSIQFMAGGGDGARGSDRGNIALSRRFWTTLEIIHNDHEVNFPVGIFWPNGEKPDMTRIPGGIFVCSFMIKRVGKGNQATQNGRIVCTGFQQVAVDVEGDQS